MAASPLCLVSDNAGPLLPTVGGVDVGAGDTITIQLADTTDVTQWYLQVLGTDELSTSPVLAGVNPISNLVSSPSTVVSFVAPAGLGSALRFQSATTGLGNPPPTTFGIYVLTGLADRVGAVTEEREGNLAFGWAAILNPLIRNRVLPATDRQETLASQVIVNTDTVLTATLSFTPISNASVMCFQDGLLQEQGAGRDYTISGTSITWLASSGTATDLTGTERLVFVYKSA